MKLCEFSAKVTARVQVVQVLIIGTLLFFGSQTARAEALPIYEPASGQAHHWKKANFFDFNRAFGFWTDLGTFTQLEHAWEACDGNKAFHYWNNVWFDWFRRGYEDDDPHKVYRGHRPTRIAEEYTADFVLKDVVRRYGQEGEQLVQSDVETVKYCHDLLRTYEDWRDSYEGLLGHRPYWYYVDSLSYGYEYIDRPFQEWLHHLCKTAMVKASWKGEQGWSGIFGDWCDYVPDWRSPHEIKDYDTALLNNEIKKIGRLQHNAQQRAESRKVIEQHLAAHRDTLSDADREALEAMIEQLQ